MNGISFGHIAIVVCIVLAVLFILERV